MKKKKRVVGLNHGVKLSRISYFNGQYSVFYPITEVKVVNGAAKNQLKGHPPTPKKKKKAWIKPSMNNHCG